MNKDLLQLIKDYTTKKHSEISSDLIGKSKDNLVAMLLDLLTAYFNDLNSSTMRELVVAVLAGYEPTQKKLGYNGYRHNTLTGEVEQCEIKPPNVRTDAKKPKKLNGGGSYSDYTIERFEKHKKENPNMVIGGFVDGILIYILEFSFNEPSFTKRLAEQTPETREKGQYKRSVKFSFIHYKDAKSLKLIYKTSKQKLLEAKPYITRELFKYINQAILLEG